MEVRVTKRSVCCFSAVVILFVLGVALITIGILVLKKFMPDMVHDKVLEEKVIGMMEDGSYNTITRTWRNPNYLTYMQYWVYNYTNPLEIQHRGAFPDLLEKGPYSYREYQSNNVEGWSEDSTQVFYRQKSIYIFDKNTSCPTCDPNDVFLVPDIIFYKMMAILGDAEELQSMICGMGDIAGLSPCSMVGNLTTLQEMLDNYTDYIALAIKARGAGPFVSVTVNDLLFQGFQDPLFTRVADFLLDIIFAVAPNLDITLPDDIPKSIDTPKANLNSNNNTLRAQYAIRTGKDDAYQSGQVLSFFVADNETNSDGNLLPETWWTNPDKETCPPELGILARRLNGTLGDFFKPFIEEDDKLYLYVPDICRSLYLIYQSRVTIKGIEGMHFIIPDEVFDYTKDYNCGFCHRLKNDFYSKKKGETCLPNGMLDISQCTNLNPPIAVSNPHFLGADKEVRDLFPRLVPDQVAHQTAIDVEPTMGLVLTANKRLQINLMVNRLNTTKTYNVLLPGAYPILWINESFLIDDGTVDLLNSELFKPQKIAKIVSWALGIGLGILCVLLSVALGVYIFFCTSRRASTVTKVEISKQMEAEASQKLPEGTTVRRRVGKQEIEQTDGTDWE